MEKLGVLGVDALAVFGYVTAEHFLVSIRTIFHGVFLSGVNLDRARPLRGALFTLLRSRRRPDRIDR